MAHTLFPMLHLQWKMGKDLAHGTIKVVLNMASGKLSQIGILFDLLNSI